MYVPKDRRKFGKIGEDIAASFLAENGYYILERNYRREGVEIDIICKDQSGCLVFAEVKSRTRGTYGMGFESVGRTKQARIIKASMSYICEHNIIGFDIRYDVISISVGGVGPDNSIVHIINAFDTST